MERKKSENETLNQYALREWNHQSYIHHKYTADDSRLSTLTTIARNTIKTLNCIMADMEVSCYEKKDASPELSPMINLSKDTLYSNLISRVNIDDTVLLRIDNNPSRFIRIRNSITDTLLCYEVCYMRSITGIDLDDKTNLYFLFYDNLFRLVILDKLMMTDIIKNELANNSKLTWDCAYAQLISVFVSWYNECFLLWYDTALYKIADHYKNDGCDKFIDQFYDDINDSYDRACQYLYCALNIQNFTDESNDFWACVSIEQTKGFMEYTNKIGKTFNKNFSPDPKVKPDKEEKKEEKTD